MTIQVDIDGIPGITWAELWPRTVSYGEAEGYCGTALLVTISRPFTEDEDKLFEWVMRQDAVLLFGVHHLSDGRDLIIFERTYVSQTAEDADREHREHLRKLLTRTGAPQNIVFANSAT